MIKRTFFLPPPPPLSPDIMVMAVDFCKFYSWIEFEIFLR